MEFLRDGNLPISELLASDQDKIAGVSAISRKGLENVEEKGLQLFISPSGDVLGLPMTAGEIHRTDISSPDWTEAQRARSACD